MRQKVRRYFLTTTIHATRNVNKRKQTGDDVAKRQRRIVAPWKAIGPPASEKTARAAEKERRAAAAVPGGFVELARNGGVPKIGYWWG